MRVLSIGNSFSQDAQRYLHGIAAENGFNLETVNLYIGGCSLAKHYENMQSGEAVYALERNGKDSGERVSLQDVLTGDKWDVITLQQVSSDAPNYLTYQPYLNALAEFVRTLAPTAKIALHQTWAYEKNSARLCTELGYENPTQMFNRIQQAYALAAEAIGADFIIPAGALLHKLALAGFRVHRDTYHASLGIGRYALGLLWYAKLSGNDVTASSFSNLDEAVSALEAEQAKQYVMEVIREA